MAQATLARAHLNAGRLQDSLHHFSCAVQLLGSDLEAKAEVNSELEDVRRLLESHWSDYHDVIVQLPLHVSNCGPSAHSLRIRQHLECEYCHLTGEQGPGGALWAAGVVLAQLIACTGTADAQRLPHIENWSGARALELGSGTGAGGLAAALMGAEVLLTDREQNVPVMELNA